MEYLKGFVSFLLCLLTLSSTPTVAAPQPQQALRFRLSEGAADPRPPVRLPQTRGQSLTTDRVEALLAPLPPLREDKGTKINLPSQPIPPPRARKVASFPPSETTGKPTVSPAKPLEVVRFAPEGDVPLAPYLSITFSQPMVALASQSESTVAAPIRITPQPPGEWRWVGTQTLVFQPRGRLPMATDYTVTVPAGMRSAIGQELDSARSWSFRTPAPTVKEFHPPTGSQPLSPVLFVAYDQSVDPAAVLARTEVRVDEKPWPVRLATAKEVQADAQVRELSKVAKPGYWLALRPLRPFPIDAGITVFITGGEISREGPRPAVSRQFGFRTYGPQELVQAGCNNGAPVCPPSSSWQVVLRNPLDTAVFTPAQVRVEPTVPGLKVSAYNNQLNIEGPFRSKTTYRVTVSGLRDQFGQTLKRPETLSIRTDAALPHLYATGDSLVTLDPAGPRSFSVYSQGHRGLKVRLLAVQPQDWPEFIRYREAFERGSREDFAPPGKLILSRTIPVGTRTEELTQLSIDLTPALENGLGNVLVVVEPESGPEWDRRIATWVQATQLGLDAIADSKKVVGWVSALADGQPLEGVQLSLSIDHLETDARGMAEFAPARGSLLIARRGPDTAFLPDSDWTGSSAEKTLRWYVVDDRKLYRPGEEVHLKGWVRQADEEPVPISARQVTYKVYDSQNNQLSQGTCTLNTLGGFDLAFTIPERANLGDASVTFEAEDTTEQAFRHSFRVEEFRRPEFEVQVSADADAYFVGKSAQLTAAASYYTGGGLPEAEVNWYVTASPTSFTPPNRADFSFGTWTSWWQRPGFVPEDSKSFKSRTDTTGKHRLRVDFEGVDSSRTVRLSASVSVNDVNRQSWNGTTGFLVHPANLYVGLRSERTFVEPGEALQVKSIVTDLEGKAIPGRAVNLRATRLESVFTRGEWREQDRDPQICTVQSELEPVTCRFKSKKGGEYRVRATIRDAEGRSNVSELRLWVAGGAYPRAASVDQEEVQLIPDQKEYQPGETARILVQSPFSPAEGLVTLQGADGILRSERFRMSGSSYTLQVPIEERYLP
ncbi:MAG: Ig-like domain-containing protein, partial [Gemmatimonadaceae bacterium]|nr:Ig-like domain-containing protein [Gloeobacterales cyanobacterium ES-bin-141]